MVSAELSHNPYLNETKVLFNGHTPQVNSAIYKHAHEPLVDWVDEVPRIFHDEMNGYDFDLYFAGTDADFMGVRQALADAGVLEESEPEDAEHSSVEMPSKDPAHLYDSETKLSKPVNNGSVHLRRKGTLGTPTEKMGQVLKLLEWLGENYNSHLDLELLLDENANLVDATFPAVLLHGDQSMTAQSRATVELVDDVEALDDVDLTGTPIIACVTPSSEPQVSQDLQYLLARKDVSPRQLFFVIDRVLDRARVERVLSDLGVPDPHVVASMEDQAVDDYLEVHLVTEYVRNAIAILDAEAHRVESELQKQTQIGEASGAAKELRIGALDNEISQLEDFDDFLSNISEIELPRDFLQAKRAFNDAVSAWRSRKQRIEGDYEAKMAAEDLMRMTRNQLASFTANLADAASERCRRLDADIAAAYYEAGIDVGWSPHDSPISFPAMPIMPNFSEELLSMKKTVLVERRRDLFGLFGTSSSSTSGMSEIDVYPLGMWRAKVREHVGPVVGQLIDSYMEAMHSYQRWEIDEYRSHVAELVLEREEKKQEIEGMLSGSEKEMRKGGEWLSVFKSQLREIKRG